MLWIKRLLWRLFNMKADKTPHPYRKNPKSAEGYAAVRKATNAARPKQVWSEALKQWVRA